MIPQTVKWICATALLLALLQLIGCGSGAPASRSGRGAIQVTIKWDAASRLIPADTRSIRIRAQILEPDLGEITNELIVDRPQGQPVSNATLEDVPSVKVRLLASAHSEPNAGGSILAQGSSEVRVPENGSVPAVIVLNGTPPPPLVVTPNRAFIMLGETVQFTASDPNVTWTSIGGSITAGGVFSSSTAGTFSVIATSVADPGRIGTATVQVTEFPPFAHARVPFTGNIPQGTYRFELPEKTEVFPASHRFFRDHRGIVFLEIFFTFPDGTPSTNRPQFQVAGFTKTSFTLVTDSSVSCSESVTFDPATGGSLGFSCTTTPSTPGFESITTRYTAPLLPLIESP